MAYNEGTKTFAAQADIDAYRLVKYDVTGLVLPLSGAAGDSPAGATLYHVKADDDVAVKLINCLGTFELEASCKITVGEAVFAAAEGKVQNLPVDDGDYRRIGTAITGADGDGDIIEVLPDDHTTIVNVAGGS